ncbi:acetamidase [Parafrankia colletiae]|uniref:Acetamidase n=1 Tax=Parafrankia colletiae TaxID=573497 RepID=A0A1S1QAK3_9ACTN|nr:acetamidase/formamidase family protein [Parafrankia colletiae]MCK9899686.1 acetamidase/formamidase family protein [Frankia sp. Cpl3]OHV30657.1 acetamidase [Parafrankia colletiae]
MALQPGRGKIEGRHYLPSTPETVSWGGLPTARTRPVLSVDSGTSVTIDTVSQEGILEDQGRDPDAFLGGFGVVSSEVLEDARAIAASGIPHRYGIDGSHVVTGPVSVRGAEPGDVLRVDILSLHPRARYGMISTRHGSGLLAGEFPETAAPAPDADARRWQGFRTVTTFCAVERRRGRLFAALPGGGHGRVRFPLNPCLGIMAVAADVADGTVTSLSAGVYGGALDCGDLGPGTHLYLPVQVPGALFAVGDPHYSLRDGMIGATALEGPLRATLRLITLRDAAATGALGALREPFIETDELWITAGFDPDPREATRRAARAAVTFLQTKVGLDRADAVAYLAAAADFGAGRLAAGYGSAFCRIRRADFTEPAPVKARLPRAGFARIVGSSDAEPDRDQAPPAGDPAEPTGSARLPEQGRPPDQEPAAAAQQSRAEETPGRGGVAPDQPPAAGSAGPADPAGSRPSGGAPPR